MKVLVLGHSIAKRQDELCLAGSVSIVRFCVAVKVQSDRFAAIQHSPARIVHIQLCLAPTLTQLESSFYFMCSMANGL